MAGGDGCLLSGVVEWPIRTPHIIRAIRQSTAIRDDILNSVIAMAKNLGVVLYVVVLIVVVVSVDLLFFRHHVWDRLIVNIGIVLVFAAVYLRFVKKP